MENQKILFIVDFNLSFSAGNTIWCSNSVNTYLTEGKMVEIWTSHKEQKFENIERNLLKPTTIRQVKNIVEELAKRHLEFEEIIVRHHNFLSELKDQEWLSKTNLYIIEVEKFSTAITTYKEIWTQSEALKKRLEEKGAQRIRITEPMAYRYDFDLPDRTDDQIRLVYCGTLRDEENILEMMDEFKKIHQERPNVLLKMVYGKIHGNKEFSDKVNQIIKDGVDGITFHYNLSHKDACYEIATSDIGICWRKKGWGENGEISTKVKEYEKYGLEIINNMKLKVGVVTPTNKPHKIDNIIRNFKQQIYFHKKLFLVINTNCCQKNNVEKIIVKNGILCEIIQIDEKFNLGFCLNQAIKKMKEQQYDIFAKFDDDDIYEKKYLLEQTYHLNKYHKCIVGKYDVPLFIPEHNNFYTIRNFEKKNQFAEICRGSTIMFNINDIQISFNTEKKTGTDSIFIKQSISNGCKVYVSSFYNYIWIRFIDTNKHTWKLDVNTFSLKRIRNPNIIYRLYLSLNTEIN